MDNLYDLLCLNVRDTKSLGIEIFENLGEEKFNAFLDCYLTKPFSNRIPKRIRANLAKAIYNRYLFS